MVNKPKSVPNKILSKTPKRKGKPRSAPAKMLSKTPKQRGLRLHNLHQANALSVILSKLPNQKQACQTGRTCKAFRNAIRDNKELQKYKNQYIETRNRLKKYKPKRCEESFQRGKKAAEQHKPYYWHRFNVRLPNHMDPKDPTHLANYNAKHHNYNRGWNSVMGKGNSGKQKQKIRNERGNNFRYMRPFGENNIRRELTQLVGRKKAYNNFGLYYNPKKNRLERFKKEFMTKAEWKNWYNKHQALNNLTKIKEDFETWYIKKKSNYNKKVKLSERLEENRKLHPRVF